MKLNSITEILPISLLSFYVVLFLFLTDTEWYKINYDTIIVPIDFRLMIANILFASFYFKSWSVISKSAFITIILLNILTELSFDFVIENYYKIYQNIIIVFLCFAIYKSAEEKLNY